jgi:hypothetical protein
VQGVVPPGGGILVGGPNHHASQHHLHTSQLLIDGLVEPHNQVSVLSISASTEKKFGQSFIL